MKRYQAFFAIGFLALMAVSETSADTRDEQEKACRSDAMHFCSEDIPNKDKITACMKQHISELSPALPRDVQAGRTRLRQRQQRFGAVSAPCLAEALNFTSARYRAAPA